MTGLLSTAVHRVVLAAGRHSLLLGHLLIVLMMVLAISHAALHVTVAKVSGQ